MENFVGSITPTGKIEGSIDAVPTVGGELNFPPYLVNNDYEKLNNKPSINGETLIGDVEIDVPTKVSELENDSGFITDYTETDPTVPAWAKNPTKPTYTAAEVGALPDTTNIPTKTSDLTNDSGFISSIPSEYVTETELSEAIADKADVDDIPTKVSELTNDSGFITGYTETDPTVPQWAKQPNKPSYTASEVGALPDDTEIPQKVSDLINDAGYITGYTETDPTVPSWAKSPIKPTYTASEVGALPDDTAIPTKTSDLQNDSGFITGYTETDPTVPSWAKQSTKPSYTAQEVGALPVTTVIPTKTSDLTNDSGFISSIPAEYVTDTEMQDALADKADVDDIPTKVSDLTNDAGYITDYTETDPTVPSWAKAASKPTYTAQEVGALPDSTVIPTKTSDLINDSGFMTSYTETDPTVPSWAKQTNKPSYTASEVGALPDTTVIPTKTSDLTNDSGFLTSYTETDPTVPSWAKQSSKPTYTASEVGALPDSTVIPSKTSDLTNDSGFITGMTILSYGNNTWDDFMAAYNANKVVYCRASSNANPATGAQNRLAFMAYVAPQNNPTSVEFQYYRSVATHTASQQGDQVYVYKLDKTAGWTVTIREAMSKIAVGTGLSSSYSDGVLTLSLNVANGNEVSY